MPFGHRMIHCLPRLRARAARWNFEPQAERLLAVLQDEADALLAMNPHIGDSIKMPDGYWQSLKRMTFAEICRGTIFSKTLKPSEVYSQEYLWRLFTELRESI
uniref:Uncharacterized protein n=1 Tax=Pyrodinium bahamense TaxID=73915 RepID=A0A7S0FE17_9DINO|mmetsp:Transcript_24765/g.67994  ORF Transcript_24765/g.67994 Transcript_24765/m.67994 type:complete len:103 (+) Transcript_24765:3-311(+)